MFCYSLLSALSSWQDQISKWPNNARRKHQNNCPEKQNLWILVFELALGLNFKYLLFSQNWFLCETLCPCWSLILYLTTLGIFKLNNVRFPIKGGQTLTNWLQFLCPTKVPIFGIRWLDIRYLSFGPKQNLTRISVRFR